MRLAGKVAIMSGAAHGMGAEEARLFAHEGAKVVIADVLEEEGNRLAAFHASPPTGASLHLARVLWERSPAIPARQRLGSAR
jgi:NAD(P)-dependent dehydrogenase (short-subunit alcohol dehydrogenase family)